MEEQQLRLSILSCLKPEAFDIDKFIAWWLEQDLEWQFSFAHYFDEFFISLAVIYKDLHGIDDLYVELAEKEEYIKCLDSYGEYGQEDWATVIDIHGNNAFYEWYELALSVLAQEYQWIFQLLISVIPKIEDEESKEDVRNFFTDILTYYLDGKRES